MRIRSITAFLTPQIPANPAEIARVGRFLGQARAAYTAAGFEVQTVRLATAPFARLFPADRMAEVPAWAVELERLAGENGIDYVSIGPALADVPQSYTVIPQVLAGTQAVFASGSLSEAGGGVSLRGARASAWVIEQAASITPDGFANLRFTALGNVPAGSPFFPAAYHEPAAGPVFAIATESADLAVQAFQAAQDLEDARRRLVDAVEQAGAHLARVGRELDSGGQAAFRGIDFTLAPHPEAQRSFGAALEALGLAAVGESGTLGAAAFITSALDLADIPRTGFCGLMLPVLEDAVLAQRAAEGRLGINDLLLYSAVCGTGLDTVPLPGAATAEQIAPVLFDLAALAHRLSKPLTARLMPIPGKQAGDATEFDFAYFANSRVLPLPGGRLSGLLAAADEAPVAPRAMTN